MNIEEISRQICCARCGLSKVTSISNPGGRAVDGTGHGLGSSIWTAVFNFWIRELHRLPCQRRPGYRLNLSMIGCRRELLSSCAFIEVSRWFKSMVTTGLT